MKCIRSIGYLLVFTIIWVCSFSSNGSCASIMVEKNLFAPDRKPPSPESVAATPQPNKPGLSAKAIQLDGIFIRGDTRKAILRVKGQIPGADKAKTQNPYIALGEGEKLGDFQVVKIENRSVSLEKDGQTEVINLFAEGKMVVPPPPMPASPVAPPAPAQQGQAPPAAAPAQMGAQPVQPQPPHAPPGVNMPGVAQPPTAARAPGGHPRGVSPPPPAQFDDNPAPDDEVDLEEEAQ
jgi:hypothetical protein